MSDTPPPIGFRRHCGHTGRCNCHPRHHHGCSCHECRPPHHHHGYPGRGGVIEPSSWTPAPPPYNPGYNPGYEPSGSHYWARGGPGVFPANALVAGSDKGGGVIYAGRAYHDGDLLPAKVTPHHGCAYISFAGSEVAKHDYEILCCSGPTYWVSDSDGRVPNHALPVGKTRSGETVYMGRVWHDGTLTPGKVHPSHRVLYIPYDGREISFNSYEVLVMRPY